MPPDAFTFDTSGQLVIQTAIGGAGTLFGPLLGATVWLYLSDFFQNTLHFGATWRLVLGLVFVLLVCFLRRGLIGGIRDVYAFATHSRAGAQSKDADIPVTGVTAVDEQTAARVEIARETRTSPCRRVGMTRQFRRSDPASERPHQTLRRTYRQQRHQLHRQPWRATRRDGPNGAGKTTFFKMLTCEVHPTAGQIVFEGRDITGLSVTDVCQLGLTKSYQVNQLFTQLTVRENLTIAALAGCAENPSRFVPPTSNVPGLAEQVEHTLDMVDLTTRAGKPVSALAYGEKRRLEVGLALASSQSLLLLDEPLAGISPRERIEMVRLLKSIRKGRTMIVVDHDMDSLLELVERITVLQEGRVLVEGTSAEIKGNKAVQDAYLGGVVAA